MSENKEDKEKEKKEVKNKEKKAKEPDAKEEKKNNKSKKGIIIVVVILSILVVSLGATVAFLLYRNSLENKTTGADWSDKYYEFIKEQNKAKSVQSYDSFNSKSEISFIQSESMKYPLMIVKGKTKLTTGEDQDCISIFGIVKDKVKYIGGLSTEKVETRLYYDIEKDKYKYYIHSKTSETSDTYTSFDTFVYDSENYNLPKYLKEKGIKDGDAESEEYNNAVKEFYQKQANDTSREMINYNETNSKVVQKTIDGKELEYNSVDEKLIDTGIEPEYFNYDIKMSPLDIREELIEGKNNYKDLNKLVTKAIEKVVKEQIELVEKVKQDIENAKTEIKADEEKKAKEAEEALYAKGLTVGSYNLKFGNYTTSISKGGIDGSDLYGTITLKPNGQFHIKTNFDQSSFESRNIDEDGTYTVGKEVNSFETQDAIIFRTNSGYKFSFFVTNNSYFNSQSSIYNYSGN